MLTKVRLSENRSGSCDTNQLCEDACYQAVFNCTSSCPCGINCIDGCSFCSSPYCSCQDLENDPDFLACQSIADQNYRYCIVSCPPHDNDCVSNCNRNYDAEIYNCPCKGGCETGCPCPEYECNSESTRLSQNAPDLDYIFETKFVNL